MLEKVGFAIIMVSTQLGDGGTGEGDTVIFSMVHICEDFFVESPPSAPFCRRGRALFFFLWEEGALSWEEAFGMGGLG